MNHTHLNHLSTILPPWSDRLGNCLGRFLPLGTMLWLLVATSTVTAQTLTNGGFHDGTVLQNQTNSWTFTANAGDKIVLRSAQITSTNTFNPWLRVIGPSSTLVADNGSEDGSQFIAQKLGAGGLG